MPQGIKAQIDEKQVEQLAFLGANLEQIGAFFGLKKSCIQNRFGKIIAKGRAQGDAQLFNWQWKAAKAGNVTMMIWLGKQRLGQCEKIEQKITGKDSIKVTLEGVYGD